MNSFNRSSEPSSLKSGESFGSGPLSLSSLPKSPDKNISSGSSASDSNNNLLLQRMESSFQHFQEMIDEAKTLNEKYVEETKLSRKVNLTKKGSLENTEKDSDTEEGYIDNIPRDNEYQISEKKNKTSPGQLTKGQGNTNDSIATPAHDSDDEFDDPRILHQGSYQKNQDLLKDFPESNVDNFQSMRHFVRSEANAVPNESESRMLTFPLVSTQENLNIVTQSPGNDIFAPKHELSPSHYHGGSPRALSVIPEESRISDDELSEGMLESDDYQIEMPNMVVNGKDPEEKPELDYFTDIARHSGEDFQKYEESRSFVDPGARQSLSPLDHFTQPLHTSRNNFQNLSSAEETFKRSPVTPSISQDRRQSSEDDIQAAYDNQPWQNVADNQPWQNVARSEIMSSAEASKKFGLHVDLPETRSNHEPSSSSLSMNDVVFSGLSSLSLSQTDESSTSGLSLQEAFRKRRPEFFKHSQERMLRSKQARYQGSPDNKQGNDADDNQIKTPEKNAHKALETTNPSLSQPSSEEIAGKPSSGKIIFYILRWDKWWPLSISFNFFVSWHIHANKSIQSGQQLTAPFF